jgi:hypothetical protein
LLLQCKSQICSTLLYAWQKKEDQWPTAKWWTCGCKSIVFRFRLDKQWYFPELAEMHYSNCWSIKGSACVIDCWQTCVPPGYGSNTARTRQWCDYSFSPTTHNT